MAKPVVKDQRQTDRESHNDRLVKEGHRELDLLIESAQSSDFYGVVALTWTIRAGKIERLVTKIEGERH